MMPRIKFQNKKEGRRTILNYVKYSIKSNKYLGRIEIEKLFHIDIRTYFKGNIEEVYRILHIDYKPIKQQIVINRIKLAMLKRRKFKSKEEGRIIISNFIKKNVRLNIFPTCTSIEKHFRINLRSYFKNIKEAYNFANIKYPRLGNWSGKKSFKEKVVIRKNILKFVKNEAKKNSYPTMKQIQKKFHIELKTYFQGRIREVYNLIGKDYSKIRKIWGIRNNSHFKDLREGRNKIASFINENIKKGIYVGYNEICMNLNINLITYFSGVKKAYEYAGVEYKKEPNQFIALEKEEKLRKIALQYLKSQGFEIIKSKSSFDEDILVKDKNDNLIPIELKAYHRSISIPNRLPYLNKKNKNEINQIQAYIKKYKSKYGILITSTNKIKINIPKNVKLIEGKILFNFLKNSNNSRSIQDLNWIRNSYTSEKKEKRIKHMKNKIAKIFKENATIGKYLGTHEIEKIMKIDLRTYFPNGMKELYEYSKIQIPNKLVKKISKDVVTEKGVLTSGNILRMLK